VAFDSDQELLLGKENPTPLFANLKILFNLLDAC